jgi:hypothetical protein
LVFRVAAYEQVRPSAGFCGRERVNAERRRTLGTSTSTLIHEVFLKNAVESWRVHRGLAGWLACQRVGACRLAGLQTSQLRSLRAPSETVALRPLSAVLPGKQDEALRLRRKLHFLSAGFLHGAMAAPLCDHGAAPA